jgi:hypothetical protein
MEPIKQFMLYIVADEKDEATELLNRGLKIGKDFFHKFLHKNVENTRLTQKFYPEILSYINSFDLSKEDLISILKTNLKTEYVTDVKLLIENNLLTDNIGKEQGLVLNIIDIVESLPSVHSTPREKEKVDKLFDYLDSTNLEIDYKEIFNRAFLVLPNQFVLTRCLKSGATIEDLKQETVDKFMKLPVYMYYTNGNSTNTTSLLMLIKNCEKFGLTLIDIWRRASRSESIFLESRRFELVY